MQLQKISGNINFLCVVYSTLIACIYSEFSIPQKRISTNIQANTCTDPIQNNKTILGMGNCNNYQYYTMILFGTPGQAFNILFDTGSQTLWIPSANITQNGFNSNNSQTFRGTNNVGSVQYADNSQVIGKYGFDYISVPPLIHVNSTFLIVNKQVNMNLPAKINGILGMDYASTNFLDLAYNVGQISTNTFSLQFSTTSANSQLYYNQIPQSILNSTIYSPVVPNQQLWTLYLIGVYFNGNEQTNYAAQTAVIDSGTSLFYLNPQLYTQFYQQYLQSCKNSTNFFLCKCNITLPTIKFMFPGVQVQLAPQSYVNPIANGFCQVFINTLSTQTNIILLGDTLFLNYIITFDKINGAVGFSGQKITSIFIVGSNNAFIIFQYVMLGFTILFVIYALIIICATQGVQVKQLKQQLNQAVDIYKQTPPVFQNNNQIIVANYGIGQL